ncbi:MAG: hypothetical protein ACXVZU_06075 [Methanobacteriaceae archaeon]
MKERNKKAESFLDDPALLMKDSIYATWSAQARHGINQLLYHRNLRDFDVHHL